MIAFIPVFSTAADKVPTADKKFVQKAAVDGMFEVEAGKVAAEKGTSPDVKAFGQRMVDDHTKANNELTQIAQGKGMAAPKGLDKKRKDQLDKLSKPSGADFDKQYITTMVKAHQEAVKAFSNEADKGKDPDNRGLRGENVAHTSGPPEDGPGRASQGRSEIERTKAYHSSLTETAIHTP